MVGVLARASLKPSITGVECCCNTWHVVIAVATRLASAAGECRHNKERLAFDIQSAVLGGERGSALDRSVQAVAAECRDAAEHAHRWAFVALAVHAAVRSELFAEDVFASALERRAERSCSGNVLPLASARRSIPAQAFSLKKYLGGIESVSSTCDNEHTTASLGQFRNIGRPVPATRLFFWVHTHNQRSAISSLKAAIRSLPQQARQESIRRRCLCH